MRNKIALIISVFLCLYVDAQVDTVNLEKLVIKDDYLLKADKFQHLILFPDSVLQRKSTFLTSFLQENTPLFFKENGYGMVSSPSFRGTTAQQTSVMWNGIRINSVLTGQTDFNTIKTEDYDQIIVKPGGGSMAYGSGAVGGAVYLNNRVAFGRINKHRLSLYAGCFGTLGMHYKWERSLRKMALFVSAQRAQSENDYEVKSVGYKNNNGEFYNSTYNLGIGAKLNTDNYLYFYSQWYDDMRHFSLISPNETKTKYYNTSSRNLLYWHIDKESSQLNLRIAFLYEAYKYYENLQNDRYSGGRAFTHIMSVDYKRELPHNFSFYIKGEAEQTKAEGKNTGIQHPERKQTNVSATLLQRVAPFTYEIGVRKEFSSVFKSPFLYSAGVQYNYLRYAVLKLNYSKNYRAPTFNDVFWQPGGNPDLKPEISDQIEISNEIGSKQNRVTIALYYNKIKNMIQWVPSSVYWQPINTNAVQTKGAELYANAVLYDGSYGKLNFNGVYAYTQAIDATTGKALFYIPKNKLSAYLVYNCDNTDVLIQYSYTSGYKTVEINRNRIAAYHKVNAGVYYRLGKKANFTLGCTINNVFNVVHQSMPYRYMPPRHLMLSLKMEVL